LLCLITGANIRLGTTFCIDVGAGVLGISFSSGVDGCIEVNSIVSASRDPTAGSMREWVDVHK